ncbi:thiamine-phosphate synthase family protein [Methanogenium organophilum]|uniref:Thiamine-phosphate synthase ThiN domain-containing protein n=1 Tax=Methanogenium organophilum TaxID=2199 RepID=A0A9X9S334_METOG|nr:thiamine-phosphate synthase family protein [Methanogenium organophilum]WAI00872.1 hypothetical protein OU421_10685 [Methanogenium organophilum]
METCSEVASALTEAASRIATEVDLRLITNHGIRMGCTLPRATTGSDVCVVDCVTRPAVRWGEDPDVARVILTVIRHESSLRSVVSVRCTEAVLRYAEDDCAFEAVPYAPSQPGSGTIDWGVESCCRDGVPDIIYGQKSDTDDIMLWIIAETPAEGARNIIMLSGCISYTSL